MRREDPRYSRGLSTCGPYRKQLLQRRCQNGWPEASLEFRQLGQSARPPARGRSRALGRSQRLEVLARKDRRLPWVTHQSLMQVGDYPITTCLVNLFLETLSASCRGRKSGAPGG